MTTLRLDDLADKERFILDIVHASISPMTASDVMLKIWEKDSQDERRSSVGSYLSVLKTKGWLKGEQLNGYPRLLYSLTEQAHNAFKPAQVELLQTQGLECPDCHIILSPDKSHKAEYSLARHRWASHGEVMVDRRIDAKLDVIYKYVKKRAEEDPDLRKN
jgi:hypothetical protein